MPNFRHITAADWGAEWERPPVYEELQDPECYIHHTAGNPRSHQTAEEALRWLNQYAQDTKGYSFLDYDYMIHWEEAKDLYTIAEGRGKWLSAATSNRNELGEAICLFGYFHTGHVLSRSPRPGHIEATAIGIVTMMERQLIRKDCKILGHYQNLAYPVPQTGCPGNLFIPHIPEVIARVTTLLGVSTSGDDVKVATERRLIDTRQMGAPMAPDQTIKLNVRQGAAAAQITVTTINPPEAGHMTVWDGGTRPKTSFMNFQPGEIVTETLWVPLDSNGDFQLWSLAETHVVVDYTGLYS